MKISQTNRKGLVNCVDFSYPMALISRDSGKVTLNLCTEDVTRTILSVTNVMNILAKSWVWLGEKFTGKVMQMGYFRNRSHNSRQSIIKNYFDFILRTSRISWGLAFLLRNIEWKFGEFWADVISCMENAQVNRNSVSSNLRVF